MTMCVNNTPVDDHVDLGLFVKREDLCCPGGPDFSKTRGVYAHIARRPERFIGVLDTSHSQGGWAVARACSLLGKQCVNFYPQFKGRTELPPVQQVTQRLGAQLMPLKAGRSAVLYHAARKWLAGHPGVPPGLRYMMPNALKLGESVEETAAEVLRTFPSGLNQATMPVLVSASSGTIAAGVLRGLLGLGWEGPLIVHLGYSRSEAAVTSYIRRMAGAGAEGYADFVIVDEGYAYKDRARPGVAAPFPCNEYYDLKALRWWAAVGRQEHKRALFWNIG